MTARRTSWKTLRNRANATMREALTAVAKAEADSDVARKAIADTARQAEVIRVRFEREDIEGAVLVRDQFGWHQVVRASRLSVTVATPYSWTDRIALDNVLEVRR